MTETPREPSPRRARLPRAVQLLLVLIGIQVVGALWPTAPPAPLAPDAVDAAHELVEGRWTDAETGWVVEVSDASITLERDGQRQSVPWKVVALDGEAVVVAIEHPTPVQRTLCRVGDRLDVACPAGVWLDRSPVEPG